MVDKEVKSREITQKIIQKMEAGEPFHCYVCIPMYPEGDPVSTPSQEILRWQFRTIESMYARIGAAIERLDTGTDPTDHLSFYCLGKRESPEDMPDGLDDPEPSTGAALTRESLRHPVYVHSKLMVVDDDYLVCGSANINQRSMAGERDTEICIGAYQPDHGATPEGVPSGGVGDPQSSIPISFPRCTPSEQPSGPLTWELTTQTLSSPNPRSTSNELLRETLNSILSGMPRPCTSSDVRFLGVVHCGQP